MDGRVTSQSWYLDFSWVGVQNHPSTLLYPKYQCRDHLTIDQWSMITLTTMKLPIISIIKLFLRWALLRHRPTAALCLACTTSLPGQTPLTAAVSSPPSEIWALSFFLQLLLILLSSGPTLQTAKVPPTEISLTSEFFPKCLHHRLTYYWSMQSMSTVRPTFRLNWKNLTKTSKQKLSCLHLWAHMYFSIHLAIQRGRWHSITVNENNNKFTDIQ